MLRRRQTHQRFGQLRLSPERPTLSRVPELPEVEALALDLRGRLRDRAIVKVHVAAFSALKTFDPPLSALEGTLVEDVTRHGKYLDIQASGLHLVLHLARAGWIRWRDEVPTVPPKPSNKSPLAVRIVLDDGAGLDVTEAGTRKSLAMYVIRDPADVPGIASLGPDPLTDDFTIDVLRDILQREGRKQIKGVLRHQGTIAGIGNAYSDELLHAARMSPFKPANSLDDTELQTLYDAIRTVIGDAVERSRGLAARPRDRATASPRTVRIASYRVWSSSSSRLPAGLNGDIRAACSSSSE